MILFFFDPSPQSCLGGRMTSKQIPGPPSHSHTIDNEPSTPTSIEWSAANSKMGRPGRDFAAPFRSTTTLLWPSHSAPYTSGWRDHPPHLGDLRSARGLHEPVRPSSNSTSCTHIGRQVAAFMLLANWEFRGGLEMDRLGSPFASHIVPPLDPNPPNTAHHPHTHRTHPSN